MMIFVLIDFGKIFYAKNSLEGNLESAIALYNDDKSYDEIVSKLDKDITLNISNDNEYVYFEVSKDVNIFTPGLNAVIGDPYKANAKRVLPNE